MIDPWSYSTKSGTEHAHQVALFMWANCAARFGLDTARHANSYSVKDWAASYYDSHRMNNEPVPVLSRLFAIKNQGHGDKIRGAQSRAEGIKSGVLDTMLPVPMLRFVGHTQQVKHGLFVELKRPKTATNRAGTPSDEQLEWADWLRAVGYEVQFAEGWIEARRQILDYLGFTGEA